MVGVSIVEAKLLERPHLVEERNHLRGYMYFAGTVRSKRGGNGSVGVVSSSTVIGERTDRA